MEGGIKTICEFIYLDNHIKIGLRPQMFLPKLVRSQFLNFRVHWSHQESLLDTHCGGPPRRVSDSVGLGWGRVSQCLTNPHDIQMLPVQVHTLTTTELV